MVQTDFIVYRYMQAHDTAFFFIYIHIILFVKLHYILLFVLEKFFYCVERF